MEAFFSSFNWPLFAIISYVFVLALIIVFIVLRGRRDAKSRYAQMLEEKETKITRMLLDLEETMEALDAYANSLRDDWNKLRMDDHEEIARLHRRGIDLEAAVSSLKARVTAIEIQSRSIKPITTLPDPPVAAKSAAAEVSEMDPEQVEPKPKPRVRVSVKKERVAEERPLPEIDVDLEKRARALFEVGEDDASVARKLGLSQGETALLQRSLRNYSERKTPDDKERALILFSNGADASEIARDMGLSVSEVTLLIANASK